VSVTTAQLSLTAALLMGAVSNPLLGRIGAEGRRKQMILAGLATVAVGCTLAAVPLGFGWLLVGRAMQGVGLALVPLAFSLVRSLVSEERAASAIASLAAVSVAGGGLGYLVTGLVADRGGVAAPFWVGLGLCVVVASAVAMFIPADPPAHPRPIDWWGAALMTQGIAAILLVLSLGAGWGWVSWQTVGLAGFGAVVVVLWVTRSLRIANPLVDLRLAGRPGALGPQVSSLVVGTGLFIIMTTVNLLVQAEPSTGFGLGRSVAVAGALLLPYCLMNIVGSRVVVAAQGYVGADAVLAIGCVILALGGAFLALMHGEVWQVVVSLGVVGLGGGFTFAAMPGLLVRVVPPRETSSAIAFNLVLRYLGFALGSALTTAVLETLSPDAPTARAVTSALWLAVAVWMTGAGIVTMFGRRGRRVLGSETRQSVRPGARWRMPTIAPRSGTNKVRRPAA
jgi:MFS family permease